MVITITNCKTTCPVHLEGGGVKALPWVHLSRSLSSVILYLSGHPFLSVVESSENNIAIKAIRGTLKK